MSDLGSSTLSFDQKEDQELEFVHIILDEGAELPAQLVELEKNFHKYFCENKFHIIVDLQKILLPPTKFIVALIEATSEARRMGGDIKLINTSSSFRNNLVTFSPRTYLSIESSEQYALYDFGETFDLQYELDSKDNKNRTTSPEIDSVSGKVSVEPEAHSLSPDLRPELMKLAGDQIKVMSKVDNLYEICNFVLDRAGMAGFDIRERGKIKVTVYEACLNVIEHSYYSNPENWIAVHVGHDQKQFVIIIQDWGDSFKFDPSRPYDVEQAVKDRRTGGFGLHIIRRSVDEIYYLSDAREGNRLILVKYININK